MQGFVLKPSCLIGLLVAAATFAAECQAAQTAAATAPRYRLHDLGVLEGGYPGKPIEMWAKDINNLGEVVGVSLHHDGLNNVGFLWRNGELQPLRDPAGRLVGSARGINDRGDIVADSPDGIPVVYRANGSVTDLRAGLGPRWPYGGGMMINNAGWVAGHIYGPDTPSEVTFLYDGRRSQVVDIPGLSSHTPVALNDAGDLLVDAYRGADIEPYLYSEGRATRLPRYSLGDGDATAYSGLNDAGQLIGTDYAVHQGNRGFVYDRGSDTFHFLGERGDGSPYPMDINEHGWAVGSWDGHGGFLYRDGQTLAFDDLLVNRPAGSLDDVSLTGINDAGQIIGFGYRRVSLGWEAHAFLANPVPEPAAFAMWLAGLGVVGWVARRRPAPGVAAAP